MKITEALNIRSEEAYPVLLFVLQSFFLGTFLGTFDVAANTLFLASFESSMISKSYAISGVVGIILTSLYSTLQNKISFHRLALLALLTVTVMTFIARFGYYLSDTRWLAFTLFIMMGPLNIIALLAFWGSAGRIFDLRQGKRLFGLIDMGQIIGIIISSWAVPVLIAYKFSTVNLMYISAFSAMLAFGFQIAINARFSSSLAIKPVKQANDHKKEGFIAILKIPYVRIMALFVAFSTFVAFFVQYLFLSVSGSRFTDSAELAKFLGALMGTLTFISVIIKSFVYGPLMKNYGLKISLLLSPIIVGAITVSAAIVGSVFGYTIESVAFTLFFLLIALNKIFQTSLKGSIESPSLKMLYQSLAPTIRYEVQARVDGTINEVSCVTSGLILSALGLISFVNTMHYIYVLLIIIVFWAFLTLKLYKGYRATLEKTLEDSVNRNFAGSNKVRFAESISTISTKRQLHIAEKSNPWEIASVIASNLTTSNSTDMILLLQRVKQYGLVELLPQLESLCDQTHSTMQAEIEQTIQYLKQLVLLADSPSGIKALASSKDYNDRTEAAKIMGASSDTKQRNNLTFLLRDLVPAVKKQAIWASRGTSSKEIITFLIEFLNKEQYAPLAHAALLNTGDVGLDMLNLALQRTNSTPKFQERVIRIVAGTGSASAYKVLLSNLKLNSELCRATIEGLLQMSFTPTEKERLALKSVVVEQAGICAWNLNAQHHCPPHSKIPFLRTKLEEEYSSSVELLFSILQLLYEKHSILAVKENLESGTSQSITFAVEMLDTFLDDDLKTYLIPLLEDSSLANKIWSLESFFPLRTYKPYELLTAIASRDNNLISKQTKIYALNAFEFIESKEVTMDLAAQLFSTDKYLRQISAQIIESISSHELLNYKKRLPDRSRLELDRLMEQSKLTNRSVVERLNFLKSIPALNSISKVDYALYNSSVTILSSGNLLGMEQVKGEPQLIFIEYGSITLTSNGNTIENYTAGSLINTSNYSAPHDELIINEDTLIHSIPFDRMVEGLYDNQPLITNFELFYSS